MQGVRSHYFSVVLRMDFSQLIGHQHLVSHLRSTIANNRVAHAQLFTGNLGAGLFPLAWAYARALLTQDLDENTDASRVAHGQIDELAHPDLHLVFPVNTKSGDKRKHVSDSFLEEWREFISQNPYGSLFDWYLELGIENKQGMIKVIEAENMHKKLALKSFGGGYKVMIVWAADKMNTECSNQLLKLIEEPAPDTVLILLAEDEEQLLRTIRSRCQKLEVPLLPQQLIAQGLMDRFSITEAQAQILARRAHGDFGKAIHLQKADDQEQFFERWFVDWVRTAFQAKGNKGAIQQLLKWSDNMAGQGRETQKKFLLYALELFRQGMLKNYAADPLVYIQTQDEKFTIEKFAPFIHQNNIFEIYELIDQAVYHIERNGNAKMIFSDLGIQLTRLIHRKEAV